MDPVAYLAIIIQGLVEFPEEVSVLHSLDAQGTLLTVVVRKEDMGRVVGKDGSNAKALRQLVKSMGRRQKARISVKFLEPVLT